MWSRSTGGINRYKGACECTERGSCLLGTARFGGESRSRARYGHSRTWQGCSGSGSSRTSSATSSLREQLRRRSSTSCTERWRRTPAAGGEARPGSVTACSPLVWFTSPRACSSTECCCCCAGRVSRTPSRSSRCATSRGVSSGESTTRTSTRRSCWRWTGTGGIRRREPFERIAAGETSSRCSAGASSASRRPK